MTPATSSSVLRRSRDEGDAATIRNAAPNDPRTIWREAFRAVRAETERRAAPLGPEDQVVQSMPDASPTKWHRAHTTWFLEQFLLVPRLAGYRVFDEQFAYLFNSYYVAAGPRHARPRRGLLTRPDCEQIAAFRAHVDDGVARLLAGAEETALAEVVRILEIGLHHEQQHQELLLTDILHAFAQNPVAPAYDAGLASAASAIIVGRICRPAVRHPQHRFRRRGLSASTTRGRHTRSCCSPRASDAASSPMRNGSNSWPTAATARRRCGSPTAGPRSRRKAGTRRAIGGSATACGCR